MTAAAYQPASGFGAKIARRITQVCARRMLKFRLDRPIVSFSFDDCPKTALSAGVKQLEEENWQSTLYLAPGLFDITNHHGRMISHDDARAAYASGHEIGGHTFSHIDVMETGIGDFLADIERSDAALVALGIPLPQTFAYPFGQANPGAKKALEKRFKGLRGITPGAHFGAADLNQIKSSPIFSGPNLSKIHDELKMMKVKPGWLTLFTHDVRDNPSEWGCTPQEFEQIVTAVRESGALVLPVAQAIDYLKGGGS